ncbi:MAG: S8 family serine peptidase [Patescibacteria group bacterium]
MRFSNWLVKKAKIIRYRLKILTITTTLSSLVFVAIVPANLNIATDSASSQAEGASSAQIMVTPNETIALLSPKNKLEDQSVSHEEEFVIEKDPTEKFAVNRLVIKFKDGVSDNDKRAIIRQFGAKFVREDLDLLGVKVIHVDPARRDEAENALSADLRVEYVHRESLLDKLSGGYGPGPNCNPNDPNYCSGWQWGLEAIGTTAGWNFNRGSNTVTVAVLDSGIALHRDIDQTRLINGKNYIDNNINVSDHTGHGTQVASVILANTNNWQDIAAVNWFSRVLVAKVVDEDDSGTTLTLATAINDVVNNYGGYNVRVINLSVTSRNDIDEPELANAINNANNHNIVVVAGAKHGQDDPLGFNDCFIGFPAAYQNVISVAALWRAGPGDYRLHSGCAQTTLNGVNYSPIDISAPGAAIKTLLVGNNGENFVVEGYGTSFAAPFVSGVASILASCSGNVANDLKNGAVNIGSPGYDTDTGYGRVHLWKALVQSCNPNIGDVSCNGVTNSTDALYILRYVAGLATGTSGTCPVNIPNEIYLPQADVNGDGNVNAVDALFVLQYTAGVRNLQSQSLIAPAVDSDSDGITDQQEAQYSCLNPNLADDVIDFDQDKLKNAEEIVLGSNPCIGDTDGDGFTDYAEFWVGTDPVLRCGENAWPADLVSGSIPDSTNRVNIMDLTSFLAPVRRINTSPGDVGYDRRWDLVPGKGVFSKDINISDLTALTVLAPPMFNGQRAFNGPTCTP